MTQINTLKIQLGKPYFDLEFLLQCLQEVLIENNETELARHIPWICTDCRYEEINFTGKHFHMFSICFQLLNLTETNGAVQNRRKEHICYAINSAQASSKRPFSTSGIYKSESSCTSNFTNPPLVAR